MVRATRGNSSSLVNTVDYSKLIFDSGADTCVLGSNWRIQSIYGPPINLIGFDSNVSKKKNLQLCTADTILEHPTLGNVLLQIHQVIHNPDAPHTLLSEYQLSEHGYLIDDKSTHHKYPNGNYGTQSFKLPYGEHTWKFDINNCLMSLPHRAPDLEELEVLTPIEITSQNHWCPSDHHPLLNAQDGTIFTFSNNAVSALIGTNAIMFEDYPSMAICFDSFDSPPEEYFDALEHEGFQPCFDNIDLSSDFLPLANDDFLRILRFSQRIVSTMLLNIFAMLTISIGLLNPKLPKDKTLMLRQFNLVLVIFLLIPLNTH